jgi:hypothetical protein
MGEKIGASEETDPEQAWMVLKLVNEWVRYADAKIAITFTFAGVTAGALYNLVRGQEGPLTLAMVIAVAVCAAAIIACGTCAGVALIPRIDGKQPGLPGDPTNPLFFGNIARHYEDDRPGYSEVLSALTRDKRAITNFIAEQVHGSSLVAAAKLKWVNAAIRCAMLATVALAAFVLIVAAS